MSSVWDRFDDIVGKDEVAEERASLKPIEQGEYTVVLEQLEAGESKSSNQPMLKARFRTTENQVIFYNKVLNIPSSEYMTRKNVTEAIIFLEGLLGEAIDFEGLGQLAGIVDNIQEGGEYKVMITYGKDDDEKSFPNIQILTDDEDSDVEGFEAVDEDDVPF